MTKAIATPVAILNKTPILAKESHNPLLGNLAGSKLLDFPVCQASTRLNPQELGRGDRTTGVPSHSFLTNLVQLCQIVSAAVLRAVVSDRESRH
jgi:hypothetical protein